MPNYEINPEFIESQYLAGENQTEFQTIAAVAEAADGGISAEPSQQTNPILIEQVERPRINYRNYNREFFDEFFDE